MLGKTFCFHDSHPENRQKKVQIVFMTILYLSKKVPENIPKMSPKCP